MYFMAFEAKFNQGRNFYLNSNWKAAIKVLKEADEMMITGMNESGAMDGDIVHYKLFCKVFFEIKCPKRHQHFAQTKLQIGYLLR